MTGLISLESLATRIKPTVISPTKARTNVRRVSLRFLVIRWVGGEVFAVAVEVEVVVVGMAHVEDDWLVEDDEDDSSTAALGRDFELPAPDSDPDLLVGAPFNQLTTFIPPTRLCQTAHPTRAV